MFTFFKNLFRRRQTKQVQVIQRDICRLTAAEWRGTPDLVKMASTITTDPRFMMMMDVIRNGHMGTWAINATMEGRALHQTRCEGYNMALNDLLSLGTFQKEVPEIVSEFAGDEERETA